MKRQTAPTRQPTPEPAGGRQNGFTLLEIMVALVVLTLIVTSAFGAIRLGERSWETGVMRANAAEDLRMVSTFLRRQFNQILTPVWSVNGDKRIAFAGDSERVQFIAPAPQRRGGGGLLEFTLSAERSDAGTRLVLAYRLFNPGSPGLGRGQAGQRITLARGLQKASLEFYGSPDAGGPPTWHQQWDAETFPELVRLRVTAADTALPWPDLYFAVRGGQTQ